VNEQIRNTDSFLQSRSTQSFFDDLGRAVRDNPVPAALIGMGAMWMLMGGGRTTAAAALVSSGAGRVADTLAPVGSAASSGASRMADGLSELASSAKNAAGQAFSAAGEAVAGGAKRFTSAAADTASTLTSTATDTASAAGEQMASAGNGATALARSVRSNLTETFERQPLLVGFIGIAVGAAIATAFPKTRLEEEMIGEQAGALKEKVGTFVSDQAQSLGDAATRAVDAVKEETKTQGLTPSALKEQVSAVGKKAAAAARTTRRNGLGAT